NLEYLKKDIDLNLDISLWESILNSRNDLMNCITDLYLKSKEENRVFPNMDDWTILEDYFKYYIYNLCRISKNGNERLTKFLNITFKYPKKEEKSKKIKRKLNSKKLLKLQNLKNYVNNYLSLSAYLSNFISKFLKRKLKRILRICTKNPIKFYTKM